MVVNEVFGLKKFFWVVDCVYKFSLKSVVIVLDLNKNLVFMKIYGWGL